MNPALNAALAALQPLADGKARHLPQEALGQAASWHLWRPTEVNAVILALAAQRPLLVLGEPGTGKSQLARAARVALGWRGYSHTLHARTEVEDLLYRFDAVQRLADAQVQDRIKPDPAYWEPQPLWLAFNWHSAHQFGSLQQVRQPDGSVPPPPPGMVLLFDEIDKAPAEVPNGLLDVLGERRFDVPALGQNGKVCASEGAWPLIVFTSNNEKDLPDAFTRRCVVLAHGREVEENYADFLLRYGLAHFGPGRGADAAQLEHPVLVEAARLLVQDRRAAQQAQVYAPGLAEYLDLLYALHRLAGNDGHKQRHWLGQLNQYSYLKSTPSEHSPGSLLQHPSGVRAVGVAGEREA